MATSIFDIKEIMPNDELVAHAVGATKQQWDELRKFLVASHGTTKEEWKFYSKKAGWSLSLKDKDRTILYLIPQKDYFMINFVLGEKAVAVALESKINASIKHLISEAVPYTEGRSFMIDISDSVLMDDIKRIIEIKMN